MDLTTLFLIIYFVINSFYFALNTVDTMEDINFRIYQWILLTLFGLPIMIYYSLPRWNWFLDNVVFWFYLWFTDRYSNEDVYRIILKHDNLKQKKQTRAIAKKYRFNE